MNKILLLAFALALFTGCKKDKETVPAYLAGEWTWDRTELSQGGLETPATIGYNHKLVLMQEGKYEGYKNNKRVEHGYMIRKDGYLCFKKSKFDKKNTFLRLQMIVRQDNDTIAISGLPMGTADGQVMYFVKN